VDRQNERRARPRSTQRAGRRPAARKRVTWASRRPRRVLGRVVWTWFGAVVASGVAWLLFGDEPFRSANGAFNPLVLVLPLVVLFFLLVSALPVLAIVRRPVLTADNYALTVRPGSLRTLVLPWAQIAELALVMVDEDPYLFIRCAARSRTSGDWPRWWDQGRLRVVRRMEGAAHAYDLALYMHDFAGPPPRLFAALARWAPAHVTLATRVSR